MFDSFIPSLVIAFWTSVAFALGTAVAWAARGRSGERAVRIAAIAFSVGVAIFFVATRSSRWALLLPLGFAAGALRRRERPLGLSGRDDG